MMGRSAARLILTVLFGVAVGLAITRRDHAHAHSCCFPETRYNPFRLPWPAGEAWKVDPGNGPGDGFHTGLSEWAIDFSAWDDGSGNGPSNYGHAVKSIGAGSLAYTAGGNTGLGNFAEVIHAGGWSSKYAHLCSFGVPGGVILQGAWLGNVGNTGNVAQPPLTRCVSSQGAHLHFEAWAGGQTADATLSGVTISHLGNNEPATFHASDNGGAAYTDARSRDASFTARATASDASGASTRNGAFSTCGQITYYMYDCNFGAFTLRAQDFVGPRVGNTGLHETFSLVQRPDAQVVKVKGAIQKAYQSRFNVGGAKVASVLGRPLGEEGTFYGAPFQGFEFGTILVGSAQPGSPQRYDVAVADAGGYVILQRTLTLYSGAGDCASVNQDASVNVLDLQAVASHVARDGEPLYDRLLDYSGAAIPGYSSGKIDVIDLQQISARFGTCGPEL